MTSFLVNLILSILLMPSTKVYLLISYLYVKKKIVHLRRQKYILVYLISSFLVICQKNILVDPALRENGPNPTAKTMPTAAVGLLGAMPTA